MPQKRRANPIEYLLPGVSDSASIAFTVLHQAPMKTVCLGQALILPKQFSRIGEHTVRVSLGKQQVSTPSDLIDKRQT